MRVKASFALNCRFANKKFSVGGSKIIGRSLRENKSKKQKNEKVFSFN